MSYGVFDIVKDVVMGDVEYAPPSLEQKRLDLCNACPQLGKLRNCKICDCFVDAKVKFLKSECPLQKW